MFVLGVGVVAAFKPHDAVEAGEFFAGVAPAEGGEGDVLVGGEYGFGGQGAALGLGGVEAGA